MIIIILANGSWIIKSSDIQNTNCEVTYSPLTALLKSINVLSLNLICVKSSSIQFR